jgi:hypothetical protein
MGHLGNPIAFRLNYNKKWVDTWFVRNLYYPEFLNKMLNIRDYLYYFFTKKSMLKSGTCLSHLNISKIRKSYIIKVYIYSIDLEKLSYDFINKIYNLYYLTLKTYTSKVKGVPNDVFKAKLIKKKLVNDLQNSDLFSFIFIYYFFELFTRNNNNTYLKYNIFLINNNLYSDKLLRRYFNYIMFKLKFSSVRVSPKHLMLNFVKKRTLLRRLKLVEYKKRRSLIWYLYNLSDTKKLKAYLEYFKKVNINKKNWKNNKLFISKFKINKFKSKYLNSKIYSTLNDNILQKKKLNFFDFFFLILKKMKFEKYNNTIGLYNKWSKARMYFNILRKNFKIKNKTAFYFLLQCFISLNKMVSTLKVRKNFRDGIYLSLYNLLGKFFFFKPLKIVINYIKNILNLIHNNIIPNKTIFIFYFMSNLNVTASLISFYLAMKFKKGFNLFGATNPLRYELAGLNLRNKQNKDPYILYNYKSLFLKKVNRYKILLKNYLKYLKVLFKGNFYKNYLNINTFHFYNTYMYYKKMKSNFINFIKLFYICIFYRSFLTFNKLNLKSKTYFNKLFSNTYNIFAYISDFIKYKFKVPLKIINFSSFFFKNILNYEYLKRCWLKFKNFNLRNIRQQYIVKYKSILMGFKFAFRGRFSRKQRASFIWIHEGKVPLNTLNLFIDYSFLTITLKNSAISIKIWLYKNIMYSAFKYILKI